MTTHATGTAGELRTIPLSKITVEDGFNPREHFDRKELERLADSIRRHGVLVPLLVEPTGDGEYRLIAGNRRYLAAGVAAVTEVPVLVRSAEKETDGLDWAVLENAARVDLNPVEEARAYKRLLDSGLTKRGVAERLSVPQKRVTERLRVLEVPEELHGRIADGTIPPAAVKALADLAAVHAGLPALAAKCVAAEPEHPWQEPVTWADVADDPVAVICARGDDDELPPDVYEVGASYPAARFSLDNKGERALAGLAKLLGTEVEAIAIRFGREEAGYAQKLGAAFPPDRIHHAVIVGQEVADTLAADALARELKARRAEAQRVREWQARAGGAGPATQEPVSGARARIRPARRARQNWRRGGRLSRSTTSSARPSSQGSRASSSTSGS